MKQTAIDARSDDRVQAGGVAGMAASLGAVLRGCITSVEPDGSLAVRLGDGQAFLCDSLLGPAQSALAAGDEVLLVRPLNQPVRGVVLGAIGRHQVAPRLELHATESVALRCGDASLELRADGKVLLKGDDVVVRAKGTKRIRAGHVAIN